MGKYPLITKLFERRQFNEKERTTMRELYQQTEMLAERMATTLPDCEHVKAAIFRLKDSLALCETALALNPRCDKQVEMPLGGDAECGSTVNISISAKEAAERIQGVAKFAHDEINKLAAYARR